MKAYITKYALTKGVLEIDHQPLSLSEGREWHRTKVDAIHKAQGMRYNKLVSLRRQIARLESLEFT